MLKTVVFFPIYRLIFRSLILFQILTTCKCSKFSIHLIIMMDWTESIFGVVAKLFLTCHLYCFNDKKIYARNTRTYNLLEVKQKMRFHYYWIWPPVYLHFAKFCISTRKLHDIFCIVCILSCYITCIAHTFHINGI